MNIEEQIAMEEAKAERDECYAEAEVLRGELHTAVSQAFRDGIAVGAAYVEAREEEIAAESVTIDEWMRRPYPTDCARQLLAMSPADWQQAIDTTRAWMRIDEARRAQAVRGIEDVDAPVLREQP